MIVELFFDSHISCPLYWLWQECGKHSMKTIWKQLKVCFDGKAAAVARGEAAAATTMAAARRLSNATRYPIVFRSCTPYGTAWIFNNVKNTCDLFGVFDISAILRIYCLFLAQVKKSVYWSSKKTLAVQFSYSWSKAALQIYLSQFFWEFSIFLVSETYKLLLS